VNAATSGGANFQATADLSLGLDVGNLEVGSNKGGSIGVSTRFQAGNIVLSGGLPSLTLAPSLNLGFGGGSRGSGSCGGGKPRKRGRHSSAGESDSSSAIEEPPMVVAPLQEHQLSVEGVGDQGPQGREAGIHLLERVIPVVLEEPPVVVAPLQ